MVANIEHHQFAKSPDPPLNTRSKEQERELLGRMARSSECLCFTNSLFNRKDNGKSLVPWRIKGHVDTTHLACDLCMDWQRLEIRITTGCTITVIFLILVMELILRSSIEETTLITFSQKAFMDEIIVLKKTGHAVKVVFEGKENL